MALNQEKRASCGLDFFDVPDVCNSLDIACNGGFDFICAPIVNPRFKSEYIAGPALKRQSPLTRSDLVLTSQDWSSHIVGKISPWINIDSKNVTVHRSSTKALKQELMFASHLSLPAILFNLKSHNCVCLARCLSEHLIKGPNQQFWIKVPIVAPKSQLDPVFNHDIDETANTDDTWEWWNLFHTVCDMNKKVSVVLELTDDLPNDKDVERWTAEPIKAIVIPTYLFVSNKKGYPVLSKFHQSLLRRLLKLDVQLLVSGTNRYVEKSMRVYVQYLNHIYQTQPALDQVSTFARGYEDYLQSPLQPLMDNLESSTYEVFEKDPVKYTEYQKAVYLALLDRVPEDERQTKCQVVMVVGAGRGPLVQASLYAASKASVKVKVYAVEKNPNAVITLENRRLEEWGDKVTVVSSDMRVWDAPEKADILVSELLGSFGDNELSPECLDGAQKFLKDDGISIPYKYTSYIAPIQSSRLYNEVRLCRERDKPSEVAFETPFVVRLHNCCRLGKAQPVFTFTHPNREDPIDNQRYSENTFIMPGNCVIHGIAGYFDTYLYKDVMLSIVPETHSPGMISWFPILFPIKAPFYVKEGEILKIHFWRLNDSKNVWYEWTVSSPRPIPVHNPKGRSYTIGL